MPFDPSTARPDPGGFDPATARPSGGFDPSTAVPLEADPAADLISQAMMAGDQPNAQVLGDPRQLGDVMGPAEPQSALDTANRLMADRNTELLGNLLYMGRELPVVGDSMAGAGTYLKDMDFGAVREADWDAVKRDWEGGDPAQIAQTVGRYIVESGGQSLADMQWMLAPQTLPAYLLTRSEESAQTRAANDGRAEPSNQDYLTGLAASGVSIALDKYGLDKIVGAMRLGDGAIQRLITAAITETITEAAQEEIEYTGEAAGTEAGYDPAQARERSLAGAIAGGGVATGLGAPAVVAQGARQGVEAIQARQQDAQLGAVLEQLAQDEAAQSLAPAQAQLTTEDDIRAEWQKRINQAVTPVMPADDQSQQPADPEPILPPPLPPSGEVPGQPGAAAIQEPEPASEPASDRDEIDDEIDAALATLARSVDPDSPWEIDEESYQEMRRAIIEDGSTPDEELPAYFQLTPKEAEAFHQARYDEGEESDVEPAEAGEPEAQSVPGDDVEPATSGPDSGEEVQAAAQPEGGEPVAGPGRGTIGEVGRRKEQGGDTWTYPVTFEGGDADTFQIRKAYSRISVTRAGQNTDLLEGVRFLDKADAEEFIREAVENIESVRSEAPEWKGGSYKRTYTFKPEFVERWTKPLVAPYEGGQKRKYTPKEMGFTKTSTNWRRIEDDYAYTNGHILDLGNKDFYEKNIKDFVPANMAIPRENIDRIVEPAEEGAKPVTLEFDVQENPASKAMNVAAFRSERGKYVFVSRMYLDHFTGLYGDGVTYAHNGKDSSPIVVQVGGKTAGLIMPIRAGDAIANFDYESVRQASKPASSSAGPKVMTYAQFRDANADQFEDVVALTRQQLADKTVAELKPIAKALRLKQAGTKGEIITRILAVTEAINAIEAAMDKPAWASGGQSYLRGFATQIQKFEKFKPGQSLGDRRRNLESWVQKKRDVLEASEKKAYTKAVRNEMVRQIEDGKGITEAQYKEWSKITGDEPMVRQLASSYYDHHKLDLPDFLRVVRQAPQKRKSAPPPGPKKWSRTDSGGTDAGRWQVKIEGTEADGFTYELRITRDGKDDVVYESRLPSKSFSNARRALVGDINSGWRRYEPGAKYEDAELVELLKSAGESAANLAARAGEPGVQPSDLPGALHDTRIPRGGLSPQTIQVSFTNRRSLFTEAFKDAGVDPNEATLWPAERQIRVLSKMFKEKYGIEVTATKRAKGREVIDQLLDGYRNVAFMLNVLNLPTKGVSLGGTLKLGFDRFSGQYLGAYYPGQSTIVLPGRTNSFAHEWFHALDHWLTKYAWPKQDDNMWSRLVRHEGMEDVQPNTLEEAFVKLLNTVFYKVPDKTGLDPKKMANQIRGLMTGKTTRLPPSDYKTEAGNFGDAAYWNDPAEMLARAFEAYVAHKLEYEMTAWSTDRATGEMITKGDRAYLSDADDRLRMTFPKSDERLAIFEAFDDLFDRLRERQLLGDGQRAQKPADNDVIDPRAWDAYVPERSTKTAIAQELDAFKKLGDGIGRIVRRKKAEEDVEHNGRLIADGVKAFGMTMRSRMRALVRKAPAEARPYLQQLMDAVSDDPGTGRYTGESFIREAQYRANQGINRVLNILATHDLGNMTDAQKRTMRDLLISEEGVQATPQMKKAAAALRSLMDDEWYFNINNGIDIGYTRNGYLPRIMVYERVARGKTEDGFTFVEQASKVYEVIFRNDVSEEWDLETWKAFLRKARNVKSGFDDGTMSTIKAISKIARKIRKLESQLKNDDGDLDEDAITAQIAELGEQAQELYGEIYDTVAKAWSDEAAADWEHRLLDGADFDYDNKTPAGQYTKKRQLPPEADKLLEEFMVNDPIDAITDYIIKSSKRVAYQKRAFPMGQNGKRYDRFELLRRQAREAGADPDDVRAMQHMVNVVTGRQSSSLPRGVERVVNLTMMLGTMSLLGRAVMVSLPETINAVAATSDLQNFVRPLAYMIGDVFRTADAKQRRQLAQAIGLVTHPIYDTMIQNRLGGEHPYTARQSARLAKFFTRTGLIPLTMAQRRATVGVAYQYIRRLSEWIQEGHKEGQQKIAHAELNELGIPPEHHQDFAEWVMQHESLPDLDDLNTPAGQLFTISVRKLSERVIIDPTTVDRPELAHHPILRVMYGIMSFTFGFYEMVTKRLGKQIVRNWNLHDDNSKARARDVFDATAVVGATAVGLFAGQLLVTTLREALLNQDQWDEKKKDGTLVPWLVELAAYRTGFTGPIEPLIQAWRGVRYERDVTALLAGAQIGFFAQGAQNMLKATTDRNSPNTNNGEHNAARAAYQVFAQPTLMYLLAGAPAGPITAPLYGMAMMALSSPEASREFADVLVGEKDSVKDRKNKDGKLKPLSTGFEGLESL